HADVPARHRECTDRRVVDEQRDRGDRADGESVESVGEPPWTGHFGHIIANGGFPRAQGAAGDALTHLAPAAVVHPEAELALTVVAAARPGGAAGDTGPRLD